MLKSSQIGKVGVWMLGAEKTWTCCKRQHNVSLLIHMIFELMGLNCGENSVPQGCPDP